MQYLTDRVTLAVGPNAVLPLCNTASGKARKYRIYEKGNGVTDILRIQRMLQTISFLLPKGCPPVHTVYLL